MEEQKLSKIKKISLWADSHFQQYKRVWRLLRKPTMQEFKLIAKVTAIGLLAIGAIGFLFSLIIKVGLGGLFK
jgi:protein translocase SEC61 complex gamma subunit